jgi:hypothetical protein
VRFVPEVFRAGTRAAALTPLWYQRPDAHTVGTQLLRCRSVVGNKVLEPIMAGSPMARRDAPPRRPDRPQELPSEPQKASKLPTWCWVRCGLFLLLPLVWQLGLTEDDLSAIAEAGMREIVHLAGRIKRLTLQAPRAFKRPGPARRLPPYAAHGTANKA